MSKYLVIAFVASGMSKHLLCTTSEFLVYDRNNFVMLTFKFDFRV